MNSRPAGVVVDDERRAAVVPLDAQLDVAECFARTVTTRLPLREPRDDAIVLDVVACGEHPDHGNHAHHRRDAGNDDDRDGAESRARARSSDRARCRRSPLPAIPAPPMTASRRRLVPKWRPYRHAANSGRSGLPMRISSRPSASRARPMLSVETRTSVPRKSALAFLDRLPPLLERREIPAAAVGAHDPQPALRAVERETSADREVLDRLFAPSESLQKMHVEYIEALNVSCGARASASSLTRIDHRCSHVSSPRRSRPPKSPPLRPSNSLPLAARFAARRRRRPATRSDTGNSAFTTRSWRRSTKRRRSSTSEAVLTYINNSPDTLREMYVHQYLNAFRPGSKWSARDERENRVRFQNLAEPDFGYERFTQAPTVNGTPVVVDYPGRARQHGRALPPAARRWRRTIRFASPSSGTRVRRRWRGGRGGAVGRTTLRNGIPKVAVYDRGGWEPNPLVPAGELYGEYGTYDVTMVVRDDQVLASTGVPVSGDPGWARVSRTGPPRLGADAYARAAARRRRPTVPEGFRAVRFVAKTCITSRGARRRTIGTRAASTCGRFRRSALSDVGHRVGARAVQAGRRHVVGRRARGRPNDLRAAVARVHLGAVRVPADHERASARRGRHRVPDDDHGRRRRRRGSSCTRPATSSRTASSATTSGGRVGWTRG